MERRAQSSVVCEDVQNPLEVRLRHGALIVRDATTSDTPALALLLADDRVDMSLYTDIHHIAEADLLKRRIVENDPNSQRFVLTNRTGELYGVIHIQRKASQAIWGDVNYFLINSVEGRRRMSEALTIVKDHAFNNLGYKALVTNVYGGKAHQTVFEEAGFYDYDNFRGRKPLCAFKPETLGRDVHIIGYGYNGEPVVQNGLPYEFVVDTPANLFTLEKEAAFIRRTNHSRQTLFGKHTKSFDGIVPRLARTEETTWEDVAIFTSELGHPSIANISKPYISPLHEWDRIEFEVFLHNANGRRLTIVHIREELLRTIVTDQELEAILRRTKASFYYRYYPTDFSANPFT